MTQTEREDFDRLVESLHYGESASIAVCRSRGCGFLTDDRLAREAAKREGVPVSGSVGILCVCAEQGLLSPEEADGLLNDMIASGYRSPISSISEWLTGGSPTDRADRDS